MHMDTGNSISESSPSFSQMDLGSHSEGWVAWVPVMFTEVTMPPASWWKLTSTRAMCSTAQPGASTSAALLNSFKAPLLSNP